MLDDVDLLVCGAGPVGCVLAERAATVLGWKVLVVDRRRHVAGNCHDSTYRGVLVHNYGPHYFRTDSADLLRYLGRFTAWRPADYRVQSLVGGRLYPFPINLTTLERFFGQRLDAESAGRLLARVRLNHAEPANSEEYVLGRVGKQLFDAFYRDYTLKQWGLPAAALEPGVCGRIPVRLDRDDRYVSQRDQVMPADGFTALFARMLRQPHPRPARLRLRRAAPLVRPRQATVYTGPVDAYFGHCFGRLPYRSLRFDLVEHARERVQPCVQINYPGSEYSITRSVEIKHVTGQRCPNTVISRETPQGVGEPFYPIPTAENRRLYARYQRLAEAETAQRRVYFCGRLAQYRYFNTDEVIEEALRCFQRIRHRSAAGPAPSVSSLRMAVS